MSSEQTKEKKVTRTLERVIMTFMYLLFGFMFLGVAFSRELSGLFVVVPLGAFSIGLTKWGLKWQIDRYLRSAKNVDDIQELSKKIDDIHTRLNRLESEE